MTGNGNWFDEKYKDDEHVRLPDLFSLYSEMKPIELTARQKRVLRSRLYQAIEELKREYTPSRQRRAFSLLFVFGPLIDLTAEMSGRYLESYERIVTEAHEERLKMRKRC